MKHLKQFENIDFSTVKVGDYAVVYMPNHAYNLIYGKIKNVGLVENNSDEHSVVSIRSLIDLTPKQKEIQLILNDQNYAIKINWLWNNKIEENDVWVSTTVIKTYNESDFFEEVKRIEILKDAEEYNL
jgi:hypothetical protein